MIKIKNVSPFGDLDVPLLGQFVKSGEVVDVDEAHAALLLIQPLNYAPGDKAAEAFLKALSAAAPAEEPAASIPDDAGKGETA
ncbi:hypothetical protein SPF06_01065 [Sinomonas sp. JGH33]|uniref:Uncharacterized protein n=1 Tax=Sinomonas terricola TaxID=3110330 RepID=A0ABU5T0W7_9MICC|nr:hypothetical protein [Sinomonas sp. JGH33]MEA5453301.1 hypothetical protein [Sinomonas sp. JGH33]